LIGWCGDVTIAKEAVPFGNKREQTKKERKYLGLIRWLWGWVIWLSVFFLSMQREKEKEKEEEKKNCGNGFDRTR
jgi:hypothetical protein